MLTRYAVFAWLGYEQEGGLDDLQSLHDDFEEAKAAATELVTRPKSYAEGHLPNFDVAQVGDLNLLGQQDAVVLRLLRHDPPQRDGDCPYCSCPGAELEHDVVQVTDDQGELVEIYDVVDCPRCKMRLWSDQC